MFSRLFARSRRKPSPQPSRFFEIMEPRTLLSAAPLAAHHGHHHQAPVSAQQATHLPLLNASTNLDAKPLAATAASAPYTPAQIRTAYGFGTASNQGKGETVAIVDAYDDPNVSNDLSTFDSTFGLPALDGANGDGTFTKVNETGGTAMPSSDTGWGMEISLDVEWAHAVAPGANIMLVEANSASYGDLLSAVDYARNHANVVSMSWGGGEFSSEHYYDSYFTSPAGNPVTFVASAGDTGGQREWPAESPNVVSVGGTSLTIDSSGNYISESGWTSSGGGTSLVEAKPGYQQKASSFSYDSALRKYRNRSGPDVAYDADPNTGFYVYDSFESTPGWYEVGGTSAGAPQWSALVAIADASRAAVGKSALDGVHQTLPAIYASSTVQSGAFHDIGPGSRTTGGTTTATGYDQVTGQGSPFSQTVINDLVVV